ncbi:hypothetical protein ABT174_33745 [Streptomyces sparsogenes]|uniref:NACHT domain-containing protein n=1 Tax=Streptomyces sparsogenes TaxID=67365 RepID=UPI003326EB36
MVSAAALSGTDPLPTVLAKTVTGELRQVGLFDELGVDFFRHPPRAGVSWLVLVDGLDEIPNSDTRCAVLTMLAGAAAAGTGLYWFVVVTRPRPRTELGTLDRDNGPDDVPRYELQPFSPDDLLTYATHWFQALDDPGRHAKAFTAELKRSRLEPLARTPLMASMLCQLYAADPARLLPDGRTGTYQSFVELIYEGNAHKSIKKTHDEAIRRLKDRHQIPRDNRAAKQAAREVRDHLPELIDHLAYERINGSTAPAVEVLASHMQASRPQKVNRHLWNAFLGDLLRPTGILAQRADDFDFLHQTLLEYHAARHATRDEQARTQLLHDLIASPSTPADGRLEPPALDDSYLGFLLDGLLAPQDRITAETAEYVEEITAHGIGAGGGAAERACRFLTTQVELRTSLPPVPTTAQLARLADGATLNNYLRVEAARAPAAVDREAGTARLTEFADDTTFYGSFRVLAAEALAAVYREAGTALLARLASDTTPRHDVRVGAAQALAWVEKEAGAALLACLADDTSLHDDYRVWAAKVLAGTAGVLAEPSEAWAWMNRVAEREAGEALLARLADDTTLYSYSRVWAAEALAAVNWKAGTAQLARLADDTTLDRTDRVEAAQALALVKAFRRGQPTGAGPMQERGSPNWMSKHDRALPGLRVPRSACRPEGPAPRSGP